MPTATQENQAVPQEPKTMAANEEAMIQDFAKLQEKLAACTAVCLKFLADEYSRHPEIHCDPAPEQMKEMQATPPSTIREAAEYFVGLTYVNYLVTVLLRLRTPRGRSRRSAGVQILAFGSYPFEPRATLRALLFIGFGVITATFGFVYAQMHWDHTLSRITDTNPGELGWVFWGRMIALIGVPLAGLIATEFPSIGNFVFSWMDPLTKALGK